MEPLICPNCNGPLTDNIVNGKTTCPYCNVIVIVEKDANKVKDDNTGLIIATAEAPKDYNLNGLLNENIQSSIYPIGTFITATSKDKKVKFFYESGKAYQQILKHMLIKHIEGSMEQNYFIPMITFNETEEYLDALAKENAKDKKLELLKTIEMVPVTNLDKSIPRVIQVEQELQSDFFGYGVDKTYDKGLTRLYKVGEEYLLLSTNVLGVKWYVNAPSMMAPDLNGIANTFMKMFDKNKKEEPKQELQENEMRTPTPGKAVSFTNWWVPAIYGISSEKMPDDKMLKDFSIFCNSIRESNTILERRYQISEQYISNMYHAMQQEKAMVNNYVANAQADIHRRQAQISQSINQRNNIINSTYQNRVASQDRMRSNYSEALRGVDTYKTSSGDVEFKTGAKRVVQKNNDPKNMVEIGYLDKIPDGWTEIFKK